MKKTKKILSVLLAAAIMMTAGLVTGLAAETHVLTPIASGATVYKNDKATLDASNTASGYIMVKYTGSVGKIKVQVSKSGSETYTYDLNSSGTYEVFPLSEGNGTYQVKVFENIQGTQYSRHSARA